MNIKNDSIYDLVAKSFTGELTGEKSVNLNNWKLEDKLNLLEFNDLKEIWQHSTRLAMPSRFDLAKPHPATPKKAGIDRLEKYRFTGTFIDEPPGQVLSILNLTLHLLYKVIPAQKLADNSYSKRKIILKPRQKANKQ